MSSPVSVCVSYTIDPSIFLSALFFFFTDPAPTEIYTLSLHDALPISSPILLMIPNPSRLHRCPFVGYFERSPASRSEEHTSELQSRFDLVCRLLLEKKKTNRNEFRGLRY